MPGKIFTPEEAAVISESVNQSIEAVDARFKKTDWLLGAVVVVLFVGFLTMLLMVMGLVVDAWRFKSNSYEGLIETIRVQDKIINENKQRQLETNESLKNIQKELQKKEVTKKP